MSDEERQTEDDTESCVYQENSVISDETRNNGIDMSTGSSQDKNDDSLIPDDRKSYKCHKCEYQANQKHNLKTHINSKHEGIKYPCQQCDHQATTSSNLQQHINSKHEGIISKFVKMNNLICSR